MAAKKAPSKAASSKAPAKKRAAEERPQVEIATRSALRAWLLAHHTRSSGVWIVTTKKSAGGPVAWNDIVEEALCFGWVDSLPRSLDDKRTMLLVTPRKPKSSWSAKNKTHVEALTAAGLMHASGLAVVDAAKASGTWSALDAVSALVVPDDLDAAFAAFADARRHWSAFPPSARRGILEWINAAKKPETRSARVSETARCAQENVRANQWRG